jgi:dTDP-glucose 4,6-dehydratase
MAAIKNIIITGGMGFIGSHFVEHVHRHTNWNIIIIDKLSYASRGFDRLRSMDILHSPRIQVFTIDLVQPFGEGMKLELSTDKNGISIDIHYIVHMAADTHVDNSISEPVPFIHNNVMSTVQLLEYARTLPKLEKFFYFSTDEVYGSAPDGIAYKETDRHNPTNPYSASKSAAEQICIAYENTYKVPVIMVNVMNAFGERQHVEKFIPKCIDYIRNGKKMYIHADETCTIPGSRFYIHARNISAAVMFLINNGALGELYHITGEKEVTNLEMAQFIASAMNKELIYEMVNFHGDRPGHDTRYALDGSKLAELGWEPPVGFEDSLRRTIQWTLNNSEWLDW